MTRISTENHDPALTSRLAHDVRLSLRAAVKYLYADCEMQSVNGEAIIAAIGGTICAGMDLLQQFDFPTDADREGMRRHLHRILDAAFDTTSTGYVAGHA